MSCVRSSSRYTCSTMSKSSVFSKARIRDRLSCVRQASYTAVRTCLTFVSIAQPSMNSSRIGIAIAKNSVPGSRAICRTLNRVILKEPHRNPKIEAEYPPGGFTMFWRAVMWFLRGGIGIKLLGPSWAAWWREREYAADKYAADLAYGDDFADYLEEYGLFYDRPVPFVWLTLQTHPPVELRIDRLRGPLDGPLAGMSQEELDDNGRRNPPPRGEPTSGGTRPTARPGSSTASECGPEGQRVMIATRTTISAVRDTCEPRPRPATAGRRRLTGRSRPTLAGDDRRDRPTRRATTPGGARDAAGAPARRCRRARQAARADAGMGLPARPRARRDPPRRRPQSTTPLRPGRRRQGTLRP